MPGKKNMISEKNFSHALLCGVLAWFVLTIATENALFGLASGCTAFLAALAAKQLLPFLKEKKRIAFIERDLPFALMSISIDLGLNIAFEKAILNIAESNLKISKEFKRILLDAKKKGMSIPSSLIAFSERTKSTLVKRVVLQLNSIYIYGAREASQSSEAVRRLALEIFSAQKAESTAFSGKLVVFSLMFIAVSAVIPAFFQSFIIVGSMVLQLELTAAQIFFAIAILFPALDIFVLAYIKAKTPVFLRD
ncbi:MAG: hypothetical protein JW772_01075 [Candidatus Diapherotrites archaeon]|nr:hypothetical protein [Candidatus Diapherotrites archaeon]